MTGTTRFRWRTSGAGRFDPASGRMLVEGHDEDYGDLSYFVGMAGEDEPGEVEVDGILQLFGLPVKSLSEEASAQRCTETGVEDPGAAAEAEWAVRRTVARTLTGEEAEDRTMSQIRALARGRAAEVFDRACGLARVGRAGWTWRSMLSTGAFRRSTSWE